MMCMNNIFHRFAVKKRGLHEMQELSLLLTIYDTTFNKIEIQECDVMNIQQNIFRICIR